MGCGASANYPNQGQQYAGQNRGGHQANRGFNNGEVSSLDSEEVLGDDNNQMGGNNQNYAPQMGHSMQNQGPGGGNFPSQLNNIPMSQTVNMGGGDGFGAGGRQVFGGKEMPEPPSSNKFTTTNNTNANQVYVESLRAFMPKDESEKPTKYVEAYQGNRQFVDNEFPPNMQSICAKPENRAKYANVVWVNPEEVYKDQDYTIFFEATGPLNIKTGHLLQNQYFVSAVSAMSEREDLISTLFPETIEADTTVNGIWLNDCGEWKAVVADNSFPADKTNGKPCFAHCDQAETWVMILEKAYAKIMGSYDDIELGMSSYALRDLTGAPYEFLESTDPDEVWQFVTESERQGYLITCYTKSTDIREEQNPLGIVFGHAYSILDAKQIMTNSGPERIIQVRNPWGKFEWKGDWGDSSHKWTPETKRQVNYVDADDGAFWISVNDFVQYYEGVGICKFRQNYFYKSINFDHGATNKNYSIFRLCVNENSHIFLSVNQKDDRCFDPNKKYDYSTVRVMVGKVETNGLKFVDGKFFCDRNVVLETQLEQGYYIVTIEMNWIQNYYKQANINAYSEKIVNFEEVLQGDFLTIQRNLLKSYVMQKPNAQRKTFADIGCSNIIKYSGHYLGILFFYYINDEESKKFHETVTATTLKNLQIQFPQNNSQEFQVDILPKDDNMVMYKIEDERLSFSFKSQVENKIMSASYQEVEENRLYAYKGTTYIDDPDDKETITRDNSFFDKYVMQDVDHFEPGQAEVLKAFQMQRSIPHPLEGRDPNDIRLDNMQMGSQRPDLGPQKGGYNHFDPERQISGKPLTDIQLWYNLPAYLSDEGRLGKFAIKGFETALERVTSPILNSLPEDKIFAILLGVLFILSTIISLIRPQFLDLVLILSLALLAVCRFSVFKLIEDYNLVLRFYPYAFLFSALLDIWWLIVYGTNWTSNDITDTGMLSTSKGFSITFSVIELIAKIIFFVIFLRKVVMVLKDNQ